MRGVWKTTRRGTFLLLIVYAFSCKKEKPPPPPPPIVSFAPAATRDVPVYVEMAGTLQAYVNAEVRARVAGTLLEQNYRDGTFVKAGDLLFTIDPKSFEAKRLETQGALEQARASLQKADADIARYGPLVEKRAAPREQLENARAARNVALGQIASAQGALNQAILNLGYTKVTAPVDGIADIAKVREGNLVGQAGPTLLTSVATIDPIRFVFQISESDYLLYADRIQQLQQRPLDNLENPSDDPAHSLELVLVGGRAFPYRGYVSSVASQVDPSTGALGVEALFPNPDMLLRPGQYGRIRFGNVLVGAVVVPQRAVQETQGKYQVALVSPEKTVQVRPIEMGPTTGAFVVVQKGLNPGDPVVIDGVQKAKAGEPVTPMPADTSGLPFSTTPVPVPVTPPPPPAVGGGPPGAAPAPSSSAPPPAPPSSTPTPPGR
jgi:membrane fusion protein (multidrug efflux system)